MAENVNGIGTNPSLAVTQYTGNSNNTPAKPEEAEVEKPMRAPAKEQVAPDDVFAYMAGTAVKVPQTYDITRYNTPEQVARIGASMAVFSGTVESYIPAIDDEFGDSISEDAKYALAAKMVE